MSTTLHPHHPHHAVRRAYLALGIALALATLLTHTGCAHAPCPLGQVLVRGTDAPGMVKMCRPGPTKDELELQRIFAQSDAPTRVDPARQAEAARLIEEAREGNMTWAVKPGKCRNLAIVPDGHTTFELCKDEASPPVDLATARTRDLQPVRVFERAAASAVASTGKRQHHNK